MSYENIFENVAECFCKNPCKDNYFEEKKNECKEEKKCECKEEKKDDCKKDDKKVRVFKVIVIEEDDCKKY